MNRMHPQLQRKKRREPSASHGTEQPGAEGSPKALDDPGYCPSTYDESEDDSDSHSSDEAGPSRKRRRSRSVLTNLKRPVKKVLIVNRRDWTRHQSQLLQRQRMHTMMPPDAVFDEWVLQEVVFERTIVDGKAIFLFQFDWDLCMKHGEETGQIREGLHQQGRGRSIVKSNKGRGRRPRDERKSRRCDVCGQSGHNARTCQSGMETSNEDSNSQF